MDKKLKFQFVSELDVVHGNRKRYENYEDDVVARRGRGGERTEIRARTARNATIPFPGQGKLSFRVRFSPVGRVALVRRWPRSPGYVPSLSW